MERRSPEPPSNGDDSVALALARRLLVSHFPYAGAEKQPRILVGRLPEDPPFEIPIPAGFSLLGSAVSEPSRGRPTVEAVLDTQLPAERVRVVYRELLTASGWIEERRVPDPGGFVRGPHGFLMSLKRSLPRSFRRRWRIPDTRRVSALFRFVARKQTLFVSADERPGAPTDVRLTLIAGRNPSRFPPRGDAEAWSILPALTPPPASRDAGERRVMGVLAPPFDARRLGGNPGGSGREPDGAYSFAAIETSLSLDAVAAHYAAQLMEAGWSLSAEGSSGSQAWSTWTFAGTQGEPWAGAFTALRLPETPRRHLLHLRADRMPDG
jgi:hypothetical protein